MRLTNKLGLPESIVRAVANDSYSRGESDISVTQLIAPPRKVALEEAHADEIEEDVSDRIWSLMGQVAHGILERSDIPNALTEERLYIRVAGWTVSGALDRLTLQADRGRVEDYKVTSVWSVIYEPKPEWAQQQNTYAEMLSQYSFDVRELEIVAILRDWQKSRALREPDYPQQQVARIPLPVWTPDERVAFIEDRVRLHQAARVELPECTEEDRWHRGRKWAVMKEGNKKATALFDHPTFAEKRLELEQQRAGLKPKGKAAKFYVEARPGQDMRCESYCNAAPFCTQWQQIQEKRAA